MSTSPSTSPALANAPAQSPFEPSPAQRRLLDYIAAHPEFKTVSDFCAAADVPRSSYERWSREPAFRAWFLREWSRALIFEGWHVLTLARANMVNSPVHFKAIFSLLFTPAGQSALAAWQEQCAQAPEGPNRPTPPAPAPVPALPPAPIQNQQPAAQKEHYVRPAATRKAQPPPDEAPPRQTRPSESTPPSASAPDFPQLPEQNQPLTAENGQNPPSPHEQLLQSLRDAISGTRPALPSRPAGPQLKANA